MSHMLPLHHFQALNMSSVTDTEGGTCLSNIKWLHTAGCSIVI